MLDIGKPTEEAAGQSDEQLDVVLRGIDTTAIDAAVDQEYSAYLEQWAAAINAVPEEGIAESCAPNKAGPGHHDSETGHPCAAGDGGDSGNDLPPRLQKQFDEKIYVMLRGSESLPPAVKAKGKNAVARLYAKFSDRYGPTGAKLMIAGVVVLFPSPVPGLVVVPAIAEGIRAIVKLWKKRMEAMETNPTEEELAQAVREFIVEAYREFGEQVPAIDDEKLAEVARSLLENQSQDTGQV